MIKKIRFKALKKSTFSGCIQISCCFSVTPERVKSCEYSSHDYADGFLDVSFLNKKLQTEKNMTKLYPLTFLFRNISLDRVVL